MNDSLKCIHVENSIRIENDGKCRACCMQYGTWGDDYNVSNKTLDEIKQSPARQDVIAAFKRGERHSDCQRCWDEEAAGFASKRIRDNEKFYDEWIYDQDLSFPAVIDVSMGNACNIKCRTCGPFNSSLWAKEFKDLGYFRGTDTEYKAWLKTFNDAFDEDSLFWNSFTENLKNIKHIDFYGGEPFLVKKQWELLEEAVEQGYASNIVIHYNTNGTIWDTKKEEILKKFKNVYIDFSIDGIEDHLHYIRYPAEWDTVFSNFKKAIEFSDANSNININVCVTISILNVFYIPETDKFFKQFTNNVYLNLVHDPAHYNIKNIPDQIKEIIVEKIAAYSKNDYYTDKVIKFMNSHIASDLNNFKSFLKHTKLHDEYRKQSFEKTFPEFYNILSQKGYKL